MRALLKYGFVLCGSNFYTSIYTFLLTPVLSHGQTRVGLVAFQSPMNPMKYAFALVLLVLTTLCYAQTKTASKPAPHIVGLPPVAMPNAGMATDPLLVSQYIRSIFQDSKGNFWFGPIGHGPIRYDVKTLTYFSSDDFYPGAGGDLSVHAIAEDKKGQMWFGTWKGLIRYDGKTFRMYLEKDGLMNTSVSRRSILVDKQGIVWVGTGGGVFRYNHSGDNFTQFKMIPAVRIADILEDKYGDILFASSNDGIFRYDGKSVKNITDKNGLGENYAGGMLQDKSGNFWFTTSNGICRYDGKTFTELTTKDGLPSGEVWGISQEKSAGIIWITSRGSTTRYDPSLPISDPKALRIFTPKDGLNCCVQSMYQDQSGNMWWGAGSGLYRFDGEKFYQVKKSGPW